MLNQNAQALGRMAKGVSKNVSPLAYSQRQLAALRSAEIRSKAKRPAVDARQRYICYKTFFEALKAGQITHKACQVCGLSKAQAHHEDYSKPFDVVWLCREHHGARHRELNETRRYNAKHTPEK